MAEEVQPRRFKDVLNAEVDLIASARGACALGGEMIEPPGAGDEAAAVDRARRASLVGLALSGGGIRSATFNLGILQSLARFGLLARFDYLSTVSGGGYIGAWLSAWIHRHPQGLRGVQQAMRDGVAGEKPEPKEIGWLRDYSNYLMLRLGFFSGDSWSTVAIYLRNLWLNLALIVVCLGFAMLLPRLLVRALDAVPGSWFGPVGTGLIALSVACILLNSNVVNPLWRSLRTQPGVLLGIVLPGAIGALFLAHALIVDFPLAAGMRAFLASLREPMFAAAQMWPSSWWPRSAFSPALWPQTLWPVQQPMHMTSWVLAGAVIYTLPWALGAAVSLFFPASGRFRWDYVVLWAPLAGALMAWMCYGYSVVAVQVAVSHWEASSWLITAFGVPVLLSIIAFGLVLHIGLVSRGFSEDVREWWGRLGGWATLVMLAWGMGFAVVIYAPAAVGWAGEWMAAFSIGWIATTVLGVLLGRAASTPVLRFGRIVHSITLALPYVFVAGLIVAVAIGMHWALAPDPLLCAADAGATGLTAAGTPLDGVPPVPDFSQHATIAYCELAMTRSGELLMLMLGLAALASVLSSRVDVNVFSLAPLYRNRLLRCYFGASRTIRHPHPFTGFDREDDVALADLAGPRQRPYPIINTAINLTTGQKLAWQQRKAGSFVFTPLYCGYQMPEEGSSRWVGRYCATHDYVSAASRFHRRGSLALSNAVTISGAAASPNAGYHSSPTVAFLLTVFSVRLGSWFQNPRRPEVWARPGPSQSLGPLLSELFGMSNDRRDFVYLSDGGHFENLGIYELVRRHCRFIVACDASCDPKSTFEDLGNAIRKCRVDLGVDIEIDTSALVPRGDSRLSPHHCALGLIRYDRAQPVTGGVGYLLYIKTTMCGAEPQDVAQYRNEHPEFPHQSTVDQFFDEPQFESYRRLGLHIGDVVLRSAVARARTDEFRAHDAKRGDDPADIDVERLFKELRQLWFPSLRLAEGALTRHGEALDRILDRIRSDERLRFLDRQLNPEWPHLEHEVGAESRAQDWLPNDVLALRAAFYLCESIIQLMQSVYIDVNLESNHDHPDNRGWMNLFRRFAAAGMVRVTWAVSSASCGARFQSFCQHHLGLGDSPIAIDAELSVAELREKSSQALASVLEANAIEALHRSGEVVDTDRVVRFALTVRSALSSAAAQSTFGFPVAFAVLRARPQHPGCWGLRYFRVADHMQRMGVGWSALLALLAAYPHTELDVATRAPQLRLAHTAADRDRFERMFRAASRVSSRASQPVAGPVSPGRETLP